MDWAKVRCAPAPANIPSDADGLALDWRDAVTIGEDGLSYATFMIPGEHMGGEIRFNDDPSYAAVVIVHGGGGGTAFPDAERDGGPDDSTDWQDLQDSCAMRVVGVRWLDPGIDYGTAGGATAGRFTRSSPAGVSLGAILQPTTCGTPLARPIGRCFAVRRETSWIAVADDEHG
jgi:hypothetical protein